MSIVIKFFIIVVYPSFKVVVMNLSLVFKKNKNLSELIYIHGGTSQPKGSRSPHDWHNVCSIDLSDKRWTLIKGATCR